ncbi:unnamed protein product, partial [Adineta steineri]
QTAFKRKKRSWFWNYGANQQDMTGWLNKYGGDQGRVIIFQDDAPYTKGEYNSHFREYTDGHYYDIYVGPRGHWKNQGDDGWANWGFQGNSARDKKDVWF